MAFGKGMASAVPPKANNDRASAPEVISSMQGKTCSTGVSTARGLTRYVTSAAKADGYREGLHGALKRCATRTLLVGVLLFPSWCPAECIPFSEAGKHIGEIRCVTGKVVQVKPGSKGVTYLNFCQDYRVCPFTVVVFGGDLRDVGDVRQLAGKIIEVHGLVKEYDGRAEIILRQARQLSGEAAQIPPLPKNYDVEKKGHYSAGKFSHPKAKHERKKRQPATLPREIPEDDPAPD